MGERKATILLIITALLWGCGFAIAKFPIGDGIPPIMLVGFRFLIATVGLFILFHKRIIKDFNTHWKIGVLLGILNLLAFILSMVGLTTTTASKNAFLVSTYVVIVPFITLFIFKVKVGTKVIIGSILTLIGILFLTYDGDSIHFVIGDVYSLISAGFFAVHLVFQGRAVKGRDDISSISLLFYQLVLSSLIAIAISLLFEDTSNIQLTGKGIFGVFYLGVINSLISLLLQLKGLRYVEQAKAAIFLSLEGVFAVIASIVLLGEEITIYMTIGFVIIFAAVLITQMRQNANVDSVNLDKG